jgi:pimeloyl-ACP methyl ester carboxylesterase
VSGPISYHREGSGPTVVLLHGIGHHRQAWRPVIDLLAAEFELIACDSPGFGRSQPLSAGIEPTVAAYVDAFECFIAELGLEQPHVAGNSMGGAIALELARRRSARAATAFSPAGFWTAPEARFAQLSLGLLAETPRAARPALLALARTRLGRFVLCYQLFGYPTRLPVEEALASFRDAWDAPAFSSALKALGDYRFSEPEELRRAQVTIAWGKLDRLLPYALQAPRARAMLPWATHLTLGAGHLPYFDDPAAVAAVIRSDALRALHAAP